jgi:AcrR family transcriptional regulator
VAVTESTRSDPTTRSRLSPDERRRHLVASARSIVERQGVAVLSMEGVAAEAGVSRALVYNYFANRAGLVEALWAEVEALWNVEPMPPVKEMLRDSTPRELFERRFVDNTRWYFDQIERGGLLYYRLMVEPQLVESVEEHRRSIQQANVRWWADLLFELGLDAERALVYSTIFNGATEQMWGLIARGDARRKIIEEVFITSVWASLERLLEDAGVTTG